MYFHHIRNLVLGSQRLMARAPIQLAEINQRMLSQWYTATLGEKKRLLLALGPGAAAGGLQGPTPAAPSAPALPPPTSPAAAPVLVHRVGPPAAAPVVMHTGQAAPGRRPLLPLSPAPPMYVVLAAPPTAAAAAAGPSSRATVPLLTLTTACPLPSM
ncbi:uncharacterized protein LOC129410311 [Boleophthalmus pectinirostris]|uniref:uncharacterized protein LOC129410311 n=1 Tax=Boleophthalmus pectinirostris TaxID=150288 RepID=UPI00242C6997|nr:uncharacterized protein LOC129410311 [Boleophthalmus pectinirostris]